jgi:arabinose-5-phosphate isomerase
VSNSIIKSAKAVIAIEKNALEGLENKIDGEFVKACELISQCSGKVIVIGMGKSGHIGNKIAATLASTGTPAFAVHPAEVGHGDLGMISRNDVVIAISYSGESDEISMILPVIQRAGVKIISMTGNHSSSIAIAADMHIDVGVKKEACPHNLAPTASTTATLAMGDAIAVSLLTMKGFTPDDFARSHPSGSLGRRLLTFVTNIMKTGDEIPLINPNATLSDALVEMTKKGLGMVIIHENMNLKGIYTDGDLRRTLEKTQNLNDLKINDVMTKDCSAILDSEPAIKAVELMDGKNINSLPVLDKNKKIVGAINMHSLMQAKVV